MTATLNSVVNVRKRLFPIAVTLMRHEPTLAPVMLKPAAVSLTVQVAVLVDATTTRPWAVLPPGALIVTDFPIFTDFATTGRVGFSSGDVVVGAGGVVALAPPLPGRGIVVDGITGFFGDSVSVAEMSRGSSTKLQSVCPVNGCALFAGHGVWRTSPAVGT